MPLTPKVLDRLRLIDQYTGSYYGPRPDWQGSFPGWTKDELDQLFAHCDIQPLDEPYEGGLIVSIGGRLGVVSAADLPYMVTHRYVLNAAGQAVVGGGDGHV